MRRLLLLSLVFLTACISTTVDVQLLKTQQPARPPDCPVNILAENKAPYPVEDLAILSVSYAPGGRDSAMNRLREQTCYYGGDTLYAITETPRNNASTLISARIARRPVE
ncbi:MAG: hypothetical protein RMJ98_11475 [Myxococcales bacterium]|nr:hypothetical protein [Polyangiaceae bacterium]MDW8249908.1 hypothetical protein [Myxococcales bacterium]